MGAVVAGVLFYAGTVLCGYLLSEQGHLGSAGAWLVASSLAAVLTFRVARARARIPDTPGPALRRHRLCSPWLYAGLVVGFAVVAGIVAADSIIVGRIAPHTWDVMVYHLTRMAYFLQQGSIDWYPANYWSQVQHAKNSAILDALIYLASFRHDSFVQAAQFGAYLLSGCATFAIARHSGAERPAAWVAALVFLLSINVVMESSTAQNDLLLTACLAGGLLFLMLFIENGRPAWLLLGAVAIGLAIGTKASALGVIPSLASVGIAAYLEQRKQPASPHPRHRRLAAPATLGFGLVALFSLPAGYVDNMARYGHPLGDQQVRIEHTFHGLSGTEIVRETALNAARLTADALRLDGFPDQRLAFGLGAGIQSGLRSLITAVGFDLDAPPTGVPFGLGIETLAPVSPTEWSFVGMHEDWSFIGPLNLLLLVPAAIVGAIVCRRRPLFWGSLAAGLLLLVVMAGRPYQPFLGRFFTILPILMAPAVALVVDRLSGRALPAIWVAFSLLVGAFSAAYAVRHRAVSPFPEVLALSRLEQLTRQHPELADVVRRYEQRVPKDARVISVLHGDSYEYPFFGDGLTRVLIPGGAWPNLMHRPDVSKATFLLYNDRVTPLRCDFDLGAGYRLRELKTCQP